jgi:hypothetical protein
VQILRCLAFAIAVLGGHWTAALAAVPIEASKPEGFRIRRAPVESKKPIAPVGVLVEQLSSPKFIERVRASRDLVRSGAAAVDTLKQVARSDRPEASLRAVAVLEDMWLRAVADDDVETTAAAFDALDELSQSDDPSLRTRLDATLAAHEALVTKYALEQIARLGGSVKHSNGINIVNDDGSMRPQVEIVLLDENWQGGEQGLRYVRRVRPGALYIIGDAHLPEGATQRFVAATNIKVEDRGTAYLGVRNNSFMPVQGINGVLVETVDPNTPASKGGMQPGDVIVAFGDGAVHDFRELVTQIKKTKPGQKVRAEVLRQGQPLDLDIIMEAWPQ